MIRGNRMRKVLKIVTLCTYFLISGCSYQPQTDSYCLLEQELKFTRGTLSNMADGDINLLHEHNCKLLKVCYPAEYDELCK